jgi:hypothetical protein
MTTTSSVARRTATALLGALAIATAVGSPAHAADASAGQFKTDEDAFTVTQSGTGAVAGTITAFHANGVQAQVHGTVTREVSGPPCVWAQATFWYADNSSETRQTSRACTGEYSSRSVDLHSSTSKDTVRVVVTLRSAVDSTSAGVGVRTATYFVGDTPDSLGTAAQLDSDVTNVTAGDKMLFAGVTTWRIDQVSILGVGPSGVTSARVQGTFTWNDVLPSARADVVVTWRYFDGSTATSVAGRLYRGGAPVGINMASPSYKEVRSLVVTVQPAPSGTTTYPAAGSSGQKNFGDYYGL